MYFWWQVSWYLQEIEKCKYKGQKNIKFVFCQDLSFCFHLILLFLALSFIHSSFMHASKQLSMSSSVDFPLCCCCLNYKLRMSSFASLSYAFFQSLHTPIYGSFSSACSLSYCCNVFFYLSYSRFCFDHLSFPGLCRVKHLTMPDRHPVFSLLNLFSDWLQKCKRRCFAWPKTWI